MEEEGKGCFEASSGVILGERTKRKRCKLKGETVV